MRSTTTATSAPPKAGSSASASTRSGTSTPALDRLGARNRSARRLRMTVEKQPMTLEIRDPVSRVRQTFERSGDSLVVDDWLEPGGGLLRLQAFLEEAARAGQQGLFTPSGRPRGLRGARWAA